MEPLHPRWSYLLPRILNRNAKCLQAVLTCVDAGSIRPRNVRGEDEPDAIIARCHKQVTSSKNIFRTGPETLEKSICSRYTCLVRRFVYGGSLLCAFLYGAVFERQLEHGSFLCYRHIPATFWQETSGRIILHGVLYDFLVKSQAYKHNILCRILLHMHKILWFWQKRASEGICQLLITSVCPKTWSARKLYLTKCWTLSI